MGVSWDWILRDMLLIENIPPSTESVSLQRAVLLNSHHVLTSNVSLGANQTFLNPRLDDLNHISYVVFFLKNIAFCFYFLFIKEIFGQMTENYEYY